MATGGKKTPGAGTSQNAGKTSKSGTGKKPAPTSPKPSGKGGKAQGTGSC